MKYQRTLLYVFFFLVICPTLLYSQGRGKVSGIITDKDTGEPLAGVNVILLGTNYGAATDEDGRYYIIGVRSGSYELKASFIGARDVTVQNVRVETDLTTEIDIQMEFSSIETGEVVVQAERKLVQRDITSTRKTVTRETMADMPGIESTADIFRLQGGTTVSSPQSLAKADGSKLQIRDESVKDIHVRGGRGGEILFMIDGVPVNHPIYGGRSVLDINVEAVEQIELLTGAFSAEYGQAQSGVVNITTRTGGAKTHGGAEYKSDDFGFLNPSYNTDYASFFLGGPEPITSSLLPALGVNIPGKFKYFFSANVSLSNTEHNNHKTRDDFSLFGITTKGRQDNSKNISTKIDWDITPEFRTTFSFNGSWKQWSAFDWDWLYYPDHMSEYKRDNLNANILIHHVLSKNTFYSLNLGYLGVKYNASLDGQTPDDFWVISEDTVYSTISAPRFDNLTNFYDDLGYEAIWRDDNTKTFTAKFDITSMIHPEHLLKTGFELQFHDISYVDIQDGGYSLSNYGRYVYLGEGDVTPPIGPYKEFGQNRWVFDVSPIIGGVYAQEKFEKEFIVINAGVRGDWFYLGNTVDKQSWRNQWEKATGLDADWGLHKFSISPRFGVSFPILEQTVVFFSYGHFNQLPELQYFYRDPYTGGFTGNPSLDYEQTILYEFGFTHQIFNDLAIDIKSYAKDISKTVGTTALLSASGMAVSLYDNLGYARARGLEFELTKGYSSHYSGKVTYTMQWADGYSSSAFDDYIRSINDFPNPIRERRLDWDVRHQIVLNATISSAEDDPISIFGFELPTDWSITLLSNFASGYPYTPFTLDPAEQQVLENTKTGPPTSTTDLKITKGFSIGDIKLSLIVDIFNIFDQNNINVNYGFNTYTGKPYVYGDIDPSTVGKNKYYDWYTMFKLRNPYAYSTGRYIKLGMKVNF